jgi:hypothetical protein
MQFAFTALSFIARGYLSFVVQTENRVQYTPMTIDTLCGGDMRKKTCFVLAIVFACLISAQGAFCWGSLTHAYITDQIVNGDEAVRNNAIYGSTAPDFANYMFDSPYEIYLMDQTHLNYFRVWNMARGGPAHRLERAAAFGFIAHNAQDYTAHSETGYVIQKAAILDGALEYYGVWASLGITDAALREELSHELIEFAGDYLIALGDPGAGQLLSDAATGCYAEFSALLIKAYAGNLVAFSNQSGMRLNQPAAAGILSGSELMFRGGMVGYGTLFAPGASPDELLYSLACYLQILAGQRGVQINDWTQVAQVIQIAAGVIQDDFADAVSQTVFFTAEKLAERKVAY